ncbi:hypothetical protein EYZ11_006623 [Aspergillus tanneri]|uniref:TauD/TfdA-like domain-containing protein n=1 Tax=Aspergillus tanneri TaxID=1220188 RepID=A0A4S3JFJ3_9EURO|nr:hypothetical protein EYZ11_006623 [Aspergillus tanneri]
MGSIDTPRNYHKEPLKLSGVLSQFEQFDPTPVIGTEFPTAKLVEWMRAPNADELIRDLAITVSRRGVVFFRAQDDLTPELQKELAHKMGVLSGKPATSYLHIHPINNSRRGTQSDDYITVIGDNQTKAYGGKGGFFLDNNAGKLQSGRLEWHSDITFEQVPCDYAVLRMEKFPSTGGGKPILI